MLFQLYNLSVREEPAGGPVAPAVNPGRPPFMGPAGGHAVILVHGYNNDQEAAEKSYKAFISSLTSEADAIAAAATLPDQAVARFYWPGDANLWIFSFASYPTEVADAQSSAAVLGRFLAQVPGLDQVSFVGHSMGCRLILELLDMAENGRFADFPPVRFLLLAAAAVPVALVGANDRLRPVSQPSPNIRVRYSPYDLVLRFAFPAGQTLAYVMGYEVAAYIHAVGLNGHPDDFSSSRQELVGAGHSDYWPHPDLAADLLSLLGMAIEKTTPAHDTVSHAVPEHAATAAHDTPTFGAEEYD